MPKRLWKKRDKKIITKREIDFLIESFVFAKMPDYQMSAFLMAVCINGMNEEEISFLTAALLHSGEVISHKNVGIPLIDKHSTGGVGDKISIPLAPAVAACGLQVPMIAGRGLGHTGGTIDKLEAIPGFRTNLSIEEYRAQVAKIGCAIMGQTKEVAPADKLLYALRDVTGTVESIPLIASSIMSKKLAEGIDGLVLDVKFGSGAFLPSASDAHKLASTMVNIGKHLDKEVTAIISNMNDPLGIMLGNTLEILECIDILQGQGPKDCVDLTVELGAEMLMLGKVADNLAQGRAQITRVLNNGEAFDKFVSLVKAQGGDESAIIDPKKLRRAPKQIPVKALHEGYVTKINCREIGRAICILGGGRSKLDDVIDHTVGIEMHLKSGQHVQAGQTICTIHAQEQGIDDAVAKVAQAIFIGPQPSPSIPLFSDRLSTHLSAKDVIYDAQLPG
jgi:pyrimidine-nucleoside phosphorylase